MQASAPIIFVTGASGFVGRHIVQRLCSTGHHVRALVRAVPERAFDPSVELVIGDLGRPETYSPALDGVSAVVHAALTDNLSDEPRATVTLFHFAAQAGVPKFVHLSSIAIYGCPQNGTITEDASPIPSPDAYSQTKLAIEEALKGTSTALEISILRLGCVYGPGGGWWTSGLLNQMRHGNLILVDQGTGIANLVHVSDVASLVARVIERSGAPFEVFNVTDGMPVSWSRYYEKLEELAGKKATVFMTADQARQHSRQWLRPSLARRVIRKISGAPIIYPLGEGGVDYLASRAVYSNEKAARILHFVPEYDLESGLGTVRSAVSSQPASVLSTS